MADTTGNIVYTSDPFVALQNQHADIRREAEHNVGILRQEVAKEFNSLDGAVRDSSYKTYAAIDGSADRIVNQTDRLFLHTYDMINNLGKDASTHQGAVSAGLLSLQSEIRNGADRASQASEIAMLKNTIELQKGNALLAEKITAEGDKTRELINGLKVSDLERIILERSNEIHSERHHAWYNRGLFDNSQYGGLVSQINNLNSQMAETRQGVTNFGTMAGVGLSSNTVR